MRYILVLTMLVGVGLALTGENIADPIVIHYLPYNTQYTTVGFANDYSLDPSDCTGHTTLGPDVVYSYTPSEDECVVMGVAIPVEVWDVSFFVLTVDGGSPSCYTGSDIWEPEVLRYSKMSHLLEETHIILLSTGAMPLTWENTASA